MQKYSLSPNNASNRKAFSPIFNIFSLHHAVFVTLCYQYACLFFIAHLTEQIFLMFCKILRQRHIIGND